MKSKIRSVIETVAHLESLGTAARSNGDESAAEASLREGLRLIVEELNRSSASLEAQSSLDFLRIKVRLALRSGEVMEARRTLQSVLSSNPSVAQAEEWSEFFEIAAWTDEWLVAAVRREPPDAAALDVLADRYWKEVFGRCYLLTFNHDKASDLAQQAWVRVLRTRQRLLPGGNFPAYVSTVATNLWRDAQRWSRRAGPMAEQNLVSLDQTLWGDEADSVVMADTLPSLNSLDAGARAMIKLDIDQALEHLSVKHRDVLIARFIAGESCAEIARRYGRTEQSVSGWIREAIKQVRRNLEQPIASPNLVAES